MSNEIVPFVDMQRMALAVAKSGLFGIRTPDQALALMMISQAEGRHPALAARDYNIISGRPAKNAESMLRDFLAAGGKVEWHTLDDTCAKAMFSHPQGGRVLIEWDIARAKRAGLDTKDMYKKFPRQMLRSRCVSEGVRTVFPAATSGFYVPEEVRDMAPETASTVTIESTAETLDDFAADAGDTPRDLRAEGRTAALLGTESLKVWWDTLDKGQRIGLERDLPELKKAAEAADAPLVQQEPGSVEP